MTIEEEIKELKKEYLGDSESLKEAKKIAVKALNEKQKRNARKSKQAFGRRKRRLYEGTKKKQ